MIENAVNLENPDDPLVKMRKRFMLSVAHHVKKETSTRSKISRDQKAAWLGVDIEDLDTIYDEYPIIANYLEYHLNSHGEAMSLGNRPYLIDILKENAKEIVIQKSVQCGVSEIALCKAFTEASHGWHVLYALPGHTTRNRFVSDRVAMLINRSRWHNRQIKKASGSDATGLKHFGNGVIHFVGSNTVAEFSEFPADIAIVDERDLCDPENLPLVRDRLSESTRKVMWHISNPRRPGEMHALDILFEKSTGNEWMVDCEHCNTAQPLVWEKNFVDGDVLRSEEGHPVCIYCGKTFNRLGHGQWVAARPESSIVGYHISKLFTASADILEIYNHYVDALADDTLMQIFYGSDLGLYYKPETSQLALSSLDNCVDKSVLKWPIRSKQDKVVMGVDIGGVLHVKASILTDHGQRMACYIGTVGTWGELGELCRKLSPNFIVIDSEPEHHKAQEFRDSTPWSVALCRFGNPNQIERFTFKWPKNAIITANRTSVMDASIADILNGMVRWPACAANVENFYKQMMVPVRRLDDDGRRYIWTKGEDHYRLADVYEWLAAQMVVSIGRRRVGIWSK